jgi:hypothetical protein
MRQIRTSLSAPTADGASGGGISMPIGDFNAHNLALGPHAGVRNAVWLPRACRVEEHLGNHLALSFAKRLNRRDEFGRVLSRLYR